MPRRHLLLPLTCLVTALGVADPAAADEIAESSVGVTLEGGGLSISAPSEVENLGTASSLVGPVTISGQLGQVQVIDTRSAPEGSGWTATAISTAFTQTAGPSIGAGSIGYSVGPIDRSGTATYTANDPVDLTGVSPVVTATAITGNNTATWNPTIHVAVSADMPAGVYRGTITHSVL
ncbi:hypothetical protein [Nocardioides houyundeii]|uniref:hypothetical protein n=1 Tax=Nocardioides houyundeii TaxID=2045452 RepID=UPI000DF13BA8|nr:hypothetical protein [Nocardioides houyundeii]